MPDREKVINAIEICIKSGCKDGIPNQLCPYSSEVGCDLNQILADALAMLKEQEEIINDLTDIIRQLNQHIKDLSEYMTPYGKVNDIKACAELLKELEAKPLRCKECSYHRNDGWCNEHGREVKESDYCSFGAWEGR